MTKASKEQLQTICLFLFINKIKNIKKNPKKNKTKQKKENCQCDDRNRASLQYPYFIVDQKMKILCLFLWGIFVQLK